MQLSSVKLAGNPKPTGSHVIFLIFLCPSVFNLSRYCRQTAGRGVPWGFKSRIESSWLSARGATPRPEMNPARLCIRGYVVDYWPIFLPGKLLRHSGNGGRASKLRLGKRLAFQKVSWGRHQHWAKHFLGPQGWFLFWSWWLRPTLWNVLPWDLLLLHQYFMKNSLSCLCSAAFYLMILICN